MANITSQPQHSATGEIAFPENSASAPALDGTSEPNRQRKSAAGKVGLLVLLTLFTALAWHVASDQLAPTSATGSVTATTALMAPRVAGQVLQVYVDDNQTVAAGTPLFSLDPAPFKLALRQAQANLDTVIQSVDASVISLASSKANVNQAQSAFDSTALMTERTRTMFDRGLASQAQLDAATTQLASATSVLESARAELESANLRWGGAGTNPQVETAMVQREQAQLNLDFATVVAPTDGMVTNLKLAPGQFVNAGTPVLTFIERASNWVVVDMRENQVANIDIDDAVSLLFDGVPGQLFEGRVRGIAFGIDPGRTVANGLPQNQSMTRWFEPARTIPVHIELSEGGEWPANVRVGSKVSAMVYSQGRDNMVALVSSGLQTVYAYLSFLY